VVFENLFLVGTKVVSNDSDDADIREVAGGQGKISRGTGKNILNAA
jgi:hypothetical protein